MALLSSGTLVATLPASAQQPAKVPRIGVLATAASKPATEAFRLGLRELGYVEGQNPRTARALGPTIPESILLRADHVIE